MDDNEYTITMQLNVKDKTLEYYVNHKHQGIAFDNIDFNEKVYNMAVSIVTTREKCTIELLEKFYY